MAKRIAWIDIAKGLLIILVILGHSMINDITKVIINSFHMATFFVLSGITYKSEKLELKEFFIKKFQALLLPYIVFSIIMLIYFGVKKILIDGYSFDLIDGLISVVLPISGRVSTTVYGLWFFPCLFVAELIFYCILWIYQKTTNSFIVMLSYSFICVSCWTVHLWSNKVSIIDILPISVLYLGYGKIIQIKLKKIENNYVQIGLISVLLFVIVAFLNYYFSGYIFDLSSMTLGIWPLHILSGIFGATAICSIAIFISKSKLLEGIGKNSQYYYGLHYEIMGIVEKIFRGGIMQTAITIGILYPAIYLYKRYKMMLIRRLGQMHE